MRWHTGPSVSTRHNWRGACLGWLALGLALLPVLVACGPADEPDSSPTPTQSSAVQVSPTTSAVAQGATATAPRATATARRTVTATRTPRPATTPTAIPPPGPAIGDEVESEGWRITITGFDLYNRVGAHTAAGVFLYLRLTVVNTDDQPAAFPFDGLVVVDSRGTSYFPHGAATAETMTFDFGIEVDDQFAPGAPTNIAVAFDIPTDATGLILTTPSRVFEIRIEHDEAPK
jgi:hypothetical protein